MSEPTDETGGELTGPVRPDPRLRPADPAGTRPKVDAASVLPTRREPLLGPGGPVDADLVENDVVEMDEELGFAVSPDEDYLPERIVPAPPPAYRDPEPIAPASAFAPRFHFITGALIAVGLAAVVALVVFVAAGDKGDGPSGPAWSSWKPSSTSIDGGAQEIASHVGGKYHLPSGSQLVAVTGGPMEAAGFPLTIALREPAASGGQIKLVNDKGVLYRMCGLGPSCSIEEGVASPRRHLLLRREALELALYSLHYLDGVEEVVVFLPPRKGEQPTQALWFRRGAIKDELSRPLDATLVPRVPSVAGMPRSPDAQLVDELTVNSLFTFRLTQSNQDDAAFLVLDPLSATG